MKKNKIKNIMLGIFGAILLVIFILFIVNLWSVNQYYEMPPAFSNQTEIENDDIFVKKLDESIIYNITVVKPTPCHTIDVEKIEDNENIILKIDFSPSNRDCIQVEEIDTITGEIGISDPKSFEVQVRGEKVFYKEFT